MYNGGCRRPRLASLLHQLSSESEYETRVNGPGRSAHAKCGRARPKNEVNGRSDQRRLRHLECGAVVIEWWHDTSEYVLSGAYLLQCALLNL
jgi:hypothetical protein